MHQILLAKKLVAVIIIFLLVIIASKESFQKLRDLDKFFYIYYFVLFQKYIDMIKIIALIDFRNNKNLINFNYMAKLNFQVKKIDIST